MNRFTRDELEFILEQGLEKIAEDQADEEDEREDEDENEDEDEVEKIAAAYGLTPEEFEYVLSEGLEKIAAESRIGRALVAVKGAGGKDLGAARGLPAGFNKLPLAAKIAILSGGGAAAGGAAYGISRRRKKTASAEVEGFTPEEINYIFEQGLEKIAVSTPHSALNPTLVGVQGYAPNADELRKAKVLRRLKSLVPKSTLGRIGVGAGAAAALAGGGALAARKRKKTASAESFTEEEINYILEQGLEKIASESEQEPSAYDIVKSMLFGGGDDE